MTSDSETPSVDRRYENGWIGWIQIGVIIAVIIVAGVITLSLSSSGDNGSGDAPERARIPVQLITPTTGNHTPMVTITGTVTATAPVDISPQVGGRVETVSDDVRPGAGFEAGQILFQIDPRDYQVAVARAEAALADADAALQQTEADAEIARREWAAVYPEREITPLAAREPQLAASRARKLAAEADLAQARLNLERTQISFPFDGRVTDSRIEAGLLLVAGQRYGSVYDVSTLEIVAPISPSDLGRLGDTDLAQVSVAFEDGTRAFDAEIVRVGAQLDARTRFIDLYIAPGEAATQLRPGQFAQIEIMAPTREDVLVLPAVAAPSLTVVRIVENGEILERTITVLDRPRGQVVVEPFDYGEGIIVSPLPEGSIGRAAELVPAANAGR